MQYEILLVDDEHSILDTIGPLLEVKGYGVTSVDNGKAAIEVVAKRNFDLVITDLVMDEPDGIEVLKNTKELSPETMVIILTGYGDMESAIDAFRFGADDYLTKPCNIQEIYFRVSRCLEKQDLKRQIVRQTEELRESKENLDRAQEIAHVGNWSRDLKTGQGKWSDEMYRILGLAPGNPEHPTHEYFLSRVHPDDRDHIESMIKKAVEERGSFEYEFRTVPINGSERIIHSRGEVECDDAGVPVRRFGINQDITETRRLQAQVQESQKTEAIVTLAGGIAHQFNNALTPIIGNIDLLQMEHGEDKNTMECLKDMKTSGLRMADLTSQMLAYAEEGKYKPQILSLSDFVDATLPLIQHTLDPAVRVETDLPLDVKDVEADSTQMQMVLSAIMANSNEAMEGPGRIRISTRNMDIDQELIKDHPGLKPGPYVCLSIEDDGKGMDEETRRRIFDPFFTTHFIGRGLGMASVYGIIKNHDGAITVDSELGKGTVVRIYLPAMEAEEEVEKKGLQAGPPAAKR